VRVKIREYEVEVQGHKFKIVVEADTDILDGILKDKGGITPDNLKSLGYGDEDINKIMKSLKPTTQ